MMKEMASFADVLQEKFERQIHTLKSLYFFLLPVSIEFLKATISRGWCHVEKVRNVSQDSMLFALNGFQQPQGNKLQLGGDFQTRQFYHDIHLFLKSPKHRCEIKTVAASNLNAKSLRSTYLLGGKL